MKRAAYLIILIALWLGAAAGLPAGDEAPAAAPPLTVGVIGASVSAGFPTTVRLAKLIGICLQAQVVDAATEQFFLAPLERGETAVKTMQEKKPTLVVGADFLFWYVYGDGPATRRLARLQQALRLLETLECPVYVGDLPAAGDSIILPARVVPPPAELALFNGLVYAWARKHANVHILPAAAWAVAIRKGEPITVNGQALALQKDDLYQLDGLHLTGKGLSYLAVLVVEQLAETEPLVRERPRRRDPEAVLKEANQGQ